jgi:hypothetical protein
MLFIERFYYYSCSDIVFIIYYKKDVQVSSLLDYRFIFYNMFYSGDFYVLNEYFSHDTWYRGSHNDTGFGL